MKIYTWIIALALLVSVVGANAPIDFDYKFVEEPFVSDEINLDINHNLNEWEIEKIDDNLNFKYKLPSKVIVNDLSSCSNTYDSCCSDNVCGDSLYCTSGVCCPIGKEGFDYFGTVYCMSYD